MHSSKVFCSVALVLVLVLVLPASFASADLYTGSLQYTPPWPAGPTDGLVVGPSNLQWATYTVTMSWTVTNTDNSYPGYPWKYTYTFGHNGGQAGISHIIIETSSAFTNADITGLTGASLSSLGNQTVLSGNPNMPEDITGLRFNPLTDSPFSMTWTFFSDRAPVWGDFYARCGGKQGGINYAFDAGFTASDTDPIVAVANGSIDFHILRPDTQVVPEPITLAMLTVGGGMLLVRRRRT